MATFIEALKTAHQRLEGLQEAPASETRPAHAAIEELALALEELGVVGEELQETNDELIAARRQLEEERERYQQLFDLAPDGYLVTDHEGIIKEANRAASVIARQPTGWLIGRPFATLIEPGFRAAFRARLASPSGPKAEGPWELLIWRKDAPPLPVSLTVSSEGGAGPVLRWILRDASARLEAEAEQEQLRSRLVRSERLETIGRLAGGIAHDFNNALTAIVGFTRLIRDDLVAGDPHWDRIAHIEEVAERAAALTRQLLAYGRGQTLRPRVIDVNATLLGLRGFLAPLIGDDISLEYDLEAKAGRVQVDPRQLEQVLINLATNARDSMPRGGSIVFSTRNVWIDSASHLEPMDLPPGNYVRIAVEDTGEGMAERTLTRVFEPFYTTKVPGQGTGMGLASAQGAVRQSGGDILALSERGLGSSFQIHLPRAEGPLDVIPLPMDCTGTLTATETILIAEDNELVLTVAAEMLRAAGYSVLEADCGESALSIVNGFHEEIHLLLTDILMPGIGGVELASQIRESRPGTAILYMSGYPRDLLSQRTELDPSAPLLSKPFTPDTLLAMVRELIREA